MSADAGPLELPNSLLAALSIADEAIIRRCICVSSKLLSSRNFAYFAGA